MLESKNAPRRRGKQAEETERRMQVGTEPLSGWMVSGYFAWVALWVWTASVLLYGLRRSFSRPSDARVKERA